MELRFAEKTDLGGISDLWDKCFPGDEAFRGYFMSEIFDPANTVVCEEGGKVVSMAHMLAMEMDYHSRTLPVCYVYAVATEPDFRGKGIAAGIMERIFRELRQRDIPLAVVVPQEKGLFEYYRRLGFAGVFSVGREKLMRGSFPDLPRDGSLKLIRSGLLGAGVGQKDPTEEDIAVINTIFETVMKYRDHIRRTPRHWERAVKTGEVFSGGMFLLKRDGLPVGYALCEMSDGGLLINELLCEDEDTFNALCAGVMDGMGVQEAVMITAACPHDAAPFAMVRVVDAERMLLHAASFRGDMDCSFDLSDRHADWNTARYTISGESVARSDTTGSIAYITPPQLAEILFGAGPMPYANLLFG